MSDAVRRRVWWLLPMLAVLAVMLPRLWMPAFGLVDDGIMLHHAWSMDRDWRICYRFLQPEGRFFPAYVAWLYALSWIGTTPAVYLGANLLVLALTTAGLLRLVRSQGGTREQACMAGLFLVTSAPAVTTFYTITKQEGVAMAWVVGSLLLHGGAGRVGSAAAKAGLFGGAVLALVVANTTKETAVAMVPISVGWLAAGAVARRLGQRDLRMGGRAAYALACVLAALGWVWLRQMSGGAALSQGAYARLYRLEWESVGRALTDWTAVLARDASYVVPLIAVFVLTARLAPPRQRLLVADAVVWMIGWEAVYLPWAWTITYYLYPFTLGAAALAGVLGGHAWTAMRDHPHRRVRRVAGVAVVAGAALWLMSAVSTATDARMQLAFDDANHTVLGFLASLPRHATVWVSVPGDQFLSEIGVHLSAMGRGDLRARGLDLARWQPGRGPAGAAPGDVIAVPEVRGQTLLSVRVPIEEGAAARRNARLLELMGDHRATVFAVHRAVRLLVFRLHQPICGVMIALGSPGFYCRPWEPFVGMGVFSFGWTVYRAD